MKGTTIALKMLIIDSAGLMKQTLENIPKRLETCKEASEPRDGRRVEEHNKI